MLNTYISVDGFKRTAEATILQGLTPSRELHASVVLTPRSPSKETFDPQTSALTVDPLDAASVIDALRLTPGVVAVVRYWARSLDLVEDDLTFLAGLNAAVYEIQLPDAESMVAAAVLLREAKSTVKIVFQISTSLVLSGMDQAIATFNDGLSQLTGDQEAYVVFDKADGQATIFSFSRAQAFLDAMDGFSDLYPVLNGGVDNKSASAIAQSFPGVSLGALYGLRNSGTDLLDEDSVLEYIEHVGSAP